ncbi:nucleoside diphosphate kinase homolog 5 [Carcharodon carcharias]|uniref:nucleoside diphosphate kinase homolog 5 n=1 Tax=Carcharodon carcharias TaxID=13397 RepID=UPI001B7DAAAF|nr:nucleoside diphosphate kinase homolog 5 [Carcharodon carcharias]XP_041049799.1 nucleoside diphosphate kinase homolog 5 [Carcharodon carcharias]XP_041049800.1 nucleoside diphosphate kinase homolog 5 [Carcharodon carcharias]
MEEAQSAAEVYVERTLALIKPDAIDNANEIEEIIFRSGFTIVQKRKVYLSPELCSDIYAAHYGTMFFPSLTAFMSSGPTIAMVIARHQAVEYWRELIGPANSVKAKETHPGSLRSLYGTDALRNAVHGSETSSAAEREIQFIFPDATVYPIPTGQDAITYLSKFVNPTLLRGLTKLCKQKPTDPIIWLADWLIANNPNKPNIHEGLLEEP